MVSERLQVSVPADHVHPVDVLPDVVFSPYGQVQSTVDTANTGEPCVSPVAEINQALEALWFSREWIAREGMKYMFPDEYPGQAPFREALERFTPLHVTLKHAQAASRYDEPLAELRAQIDPHVTRWDLVHPHQEGYVGIKLATPQSLAFMQSKISLLLHDYRGAMLPIKGTLALLTRDGYAGQAYADHRESIHSSMALLAEVVRIADALLPMEPEIVPLHDIPAQVGDELQRWVDLHRQNRGYHPEISVQMAREIALVTPDARETVGRIPYDGTLPAVVFSHTLIDLLLNNAGQNIVKAYAALEKRPKDGRRVTVRMAVDSRNSNQWFMLIDDYGPGFPDHMNQDGAFIQGFTQWSGNVEGTGIGMYSLSRCIRALDGKLIPINRVGKRRRTLGARTALAFPPVTPSGQQSVSLP